jgi:DNA helicase-2/ATP-dependent DNA helicase PcrA
LSYATSRFIWGNLVSSEPSRFIEEIDSKHLNFEAQQRGMGKSLNGRSSQFDEPFTGGLNKSTSSPMSAFKSLNEMDTSKTKTGASLDLKVGYNVLHDRFGKGKVTKLEGNDADKKATIFFPHHGAKTVLLRFANLTIVDID